MGNDHGDRFAWMSSASCAKVPVLRAQLEGFNGPHVSREALALCQGCPVRVECICHSVAIKADFGYFGAVSPARRRQLRTARAIIEDLIDEGRLPPSAARNPLLDRVDALDDADVSADLEFL